MRKEVLYGGYFLITFLVIGIVFLTSPLPNPTGDAVYQEVETEKVWNFNNVSDYVYNSSIIINETVQLKLITFTNTSVIEETNESALVSATEYEEDDDEGKNRTEKMQSIGQGQVQLKESESVLEIKLASPLQNNDHLSLYLLSGTTAGGKVYICKSKTGCNVSEYGEITLPDNIPEAWYNVTLSGLSVANDTFFVNSPDKLKIDMMKGYQKSIRTETTTSASYHSSAYVQTNDLQPIDWKQWKTFSKVEQLNGQQVQYEYSIDSGLSWAVIPVNDSLSSVLEKKIRFRITLISNTTATPLVDSIKITYTTQQPCTESWTAQYGSCLVNDYQLKSYTDTNWCGTTASLPSDNGTYVSCDYCIPQWTEVNSSCRKDNLIKAAFMDANKCYAVTSLVSDNNSPSSKNYSCSYCALFNCSQSVIEESLPEIRGNKTIYIVDAVAEANTRLELEAGDSSSVEIIEYSHNIKNETPSSKPLGRYVALESSGSTSSVTIILYYDDTEITTANINEETIHIYYYNETSSQWEALSTVVNMTGNYVSTTVPHLSLYGLFGEPQSSTDSSASSTKMSGGGATSLEADFKKSISEASEIVLPIQSQLDSLIEPVPASKSSCDYVVEMSLPDEIVLEENESYRGEIVNKGNCDIADLKLGLSKELEPEADLSMVGPLSLEAGNKTNFILIRKKASDNDLFSATSYAISSLKSDPTISGYIILEGHDDEEKIFRKELAVKIIMKSAISRKELITTILIMIVLVLAVLRSFLTEPSSRNL